MPFQPPQRRINVRSIQATKRNVPVDEIIAIEGQSPWATGIDVAGNVIGNALSKRAELRRQGEELARVEAAYGLQPGELSGLGDTGTAMKLAENIQSRRTPSQVIQINPDGSQSVIEVPAGVKFGGTVKAPSQLGGTTGAGGRPASTSYVDSVDGTPLFRVGTNLVRAGGGPLIGKPVTAKGQGEAVQTTSRSLEILPKIDSLFDSLAQKGETSARLSTAPGIGKVFYPEINQLKNEVKQIGFTFGGKNFTGTEEAIISDALIPGPFDNASSRENKRVALKGYISGQIDLLGAANLLGPAGSKIKDVIQGKTSLKQIEKTKPTPITPSKIGRFTVEVE